MLSVQNYISILLNLKYYAIATAEIEKRMITCMQCNAVQCNVNIVY